MVKNWCYRTRMVNWKVAAHVRWTWWRWHWGTWRAVRWRPLVHSLSVFFVHLKQPFKFLLDIINLMRTTKLITHYSSKQTFLLTCLSVLTILEAKLCFDSYTSFALEPWRPKIWSNLIKCIIHKFLIKWQTRRRIGWIDDILFLSVKQIDFFVWKMSKKLW